jgi:hypothetical protein
MYKFLIQSRRLQGRGKQIEQDGQSVQEEADKLSKEISTLHEEIDGECNTVIKQLHYCAHMMDIYILSKK